MSQKKISTHKRNRIFEYFSQDITVAAAAKLAGVNRNTVNYYYNKIREMVLRESLTEAGRETGEFELDESYFGAKCVSGKRGRGAAGKTPVFGLLKRRNTGPAVSCVTGRSYSAGNSRTPGSAARRNQKRI